MINKERMINNFLDYVQIDSETKNEKEMCDYITKKMRDLGFEVTTDNAGEKIDSNGYNVCIKYPGDSSKDPILLSAHLDTVTPGNGIKPIVDGDIIKTDGTTILGGDDKAGVAIIVECLEAIKENNVSSRPIEAVFSIYEEGGLKGAKEFDTSTLKAKEGIVIDSGGPIGSIVTLAPAQDVINVDVYGKAAHAGMEPEAGVSAIQIAAKALENMKLYRIDEETTANFGIISGGSATNIITDHVHLVGETRSLNIDKITNQTESMKQAFENAAKELGGSVKFDAVRVYNPIKADENSKIIKDLKVAFEETGFTPQCVPTGGGSDTNVYAEKGINCVNISCGMSAVHTTDEFIKISDIDGCARALYAF
ncbi:M20/M25/M40 family metallo-hydrolase, partial [Erysipelotrichaceae bacterium OttesenSCG-928-M19]|nr:M20/M25/M40 family metallo-hydrolase [Erysipelotrichaceae bacterium OttesenSCG-928-M19]